MQIYQNPSSAHLRRFGITWACSVSVLAILLYVRRGWAAAAFVPFLGALTGWIAWFYPIRIKPLYTIWMGLTAKIAWVVSTVTLTVVFWAIFTPVALWFKIIRRDPLKLKKTSFKGDSYWQDHEKIENVAYYKHLF